MVAFQRDTSAAKSNLFSPDNLATTHQFLLASLSFHGLPRIKYLLHRPLPAKKGAHTNESGCRYIPCKSTTTLSRTSRILMCDVPGTLNITLSPPLVLRLTLDHRRRVYRLIHSVCVLSAVVTIFSAVDMTVVISPLLRSISREPSILPSPCVLTIYHADHDPSPVSQGQRNQVRNMSTFLRVRGCMACANPYLHS